MGKNKKIKKRTLFNYEHLEDSYHVLFTFA